MAVINKQNSMLGFGGYARAVLLRMLEQQGITVEQLCSGNSLQAEQIADLNHELEMEEFETLLLQALRLSGRPELLLDYGQEFSLATLGALGYAFMCCANLQEMLDLLIRYHRLLSPGCDIRYTHEDETVRLTLHKGLVGQKVKSIDSEIFFSGAVTVVGSLLGSDSLHIKAEFSHPAPIYVQAYDRIFGSDVGFQCSSNSLSFDAGLLDQPLQFANPAMKQIYQQQCDTMLERLEQGRVSLRVQQLLLEQPGQFPGIEQTAERLCIGTRTLRRRLAAENTTYKQLVQDVRCQLAEEYLRDSPLSIQEIADMLGYSDVANFRRAFIAWKGVSPAQFRRS